MGCFVKSPKTGNGFPCFVCRREPRQARPSYDAVMPAAEWKMWLKITVGWIILTFFAMAVAVNVYSCSRREGPAPVQERR